MLTNENTKISLDINIFFAKNFKGKSLGISFIEKPKSIFFKTHFGLHTFFVNFPLDIVILDKNGKVVKLKKNLQPNKIFLWNPLYGSVLELPAGTIDKLKMEIGHILMFALS